MTNAILSVAGVPEHFNLPWRLLAASNLLDPLKLSLQWTDVPEGTGAMIQQLRNGEADVALLLTEGAVAGAANGGGFRILAEYVSSPLLWGIHVAAGSDIADEQDLPGRKFAISRYGSGSHLMAGVYTKQKQWATQADYEVVNTLDGARAALADGSADIFLWEQFTTQPYVNNGEFRRVGVVPTPWPCFAVCVSDHSKLGHAAISAVVDAVLGIAAMLKAWPDSAALFSQRYGLTSDQIQLWLALTQWSGDGRFDPVWVGKISEALIGAGVIDTPATPEQVLVTR